MVAAVVVDGEATKATMAVEEVAEARWTATEGPVGDTVAAEEAVASLAGTAPMIPAAVTEATLEGVTGAVCSRREDMAVAEAAGTTLVVTVLPEEAWGPEGV